jgi:hypothetical protein
MTDTSFAQHNPLARLTKAALAIGGVLGAAYIVVSRGELIGAEAMLTGRWMVAHNLHFASAAFLLFGVVGLYLSHSRFMKLGGHFAFVLALLGTAFFFATGVMSSALLPAIAAYSPRAGAAAGPRPNPPLPAYSRSAGWALVSSSPGPDCFRSGPGGSPRLVPRSDSCRRIPLAPRPG